MKHRTILKLCIYATVLLTLMVTIFSGCGTSNVSYGLYEDAVANLKGQQELSLHMKQEITTIVSGGSMTAISNANVKAVQLDASPIVQIEGTINAIGATANYAMYYENGVCYMDIADDKTKVECDLSAALQEYTGFIMDSKQMDMLLSLTKEELSEADLQSPTGYTVISVEMDSEKFGTILGYDASKFSTVVVTYTIDQNACFSNITVETQINTVYAELETNIQIKLELAFTQSEEEIVVIAPDDLGTYTNREETP